MLVCNFQELSFKNLLKAKYDTLRIKRLKSEGPVRKTDVVIYSFLLTNLKVQIPTNAKYVLRGNRYGSFEDDKVFPCSTLLNELFTFKFTEIFLETIKEHRKLNFLFYPPLAEALLR